MTGLYSIDSPRKLFEKLERNFSELCKSPSEDGIFDVIFPLYHLREWICPGRYESYKNKSESELTIAEMLHKNLHEMPEYEIVRALCNNAKHYNVSNLSERTNILKGKRAGLGRCGDSLGVTHFVIDGKEIRDIFWPVYKVYFEYFLENQLVTVADSQGGAAVAD